jgi:hypothetical protein
VHAPPVDPALRLRPIAVAGIHSAMLTSDVRVLIVNEMKAVPVGRGHGPLPSLRACQGRVLPKKVLGWGPMEAGVDR